jgi:hypothetical protein
MAALKVEVLHSASLHPAGRGQIERMVRTVKEMMKKLLATRRDLNWEYIPFIVAKILNNSICPKTGFSPSSMVYGKDGAGLSFLELDRLSIPHHLVKNNLQMVESKSQEIAEMTCIATEKLTELRILQNEKKNQHRVVKDFKEGDYVFCEFHPSVPGATRPLKTKLNPSPFIVVRSFYTTVLLRKLADGFLTMYHKDAVKKYDKTSPLFNCLPKEVTRVLLYKFSELLESDLKTLIAVDNLDPPNGLQLFEEDEPLVTTNNDNPEPGPSGITKRPTNATESDQADEESESIVQNPPLDDSDSKDESEGMVLRGGKRVTFND